VNLRRVFAVFGIFAIASCGGGGGSSSNSSSSGTGQLRFVQASVDAPAVNLVVDGTTLATNLAYSNISDYQSLKTGSRHVQVAPVNSGSAILDTTISIAGGGSQTLLLTGPVAHVQSDLVTDGGTTATTGDGHVRVLNAASKMPPTDVYLIPSGTPLTGMQPVASNLSYNKDTGYQLLVAGSYEVFLTLPGTTAVLLTTGPINLNTSQDQTVVVLDRTSGGFTYTLLTDP
jgi:Domain of unknown function (DUF4397)